MRFFRFLGLLSLGIFLFTCFSAILVGSFYHPFFTSSRGQESNLRQAKRYKLYEINERTNEVTERLIELYENLEDESLFYQTEHGRNILVTNLKSKPFHCTASCSCSEETTRKSVSLTVTKGLVFLVGALSSAIAYQKATEYFSEECKIRLSETTTTCQESRVVWEIDGCDFLHGTEEEGFPKIETTGEEEISEEEMKAFDEKYPDADSDSYNPIEYYPVYACTGKCLYKKFDLESTFKQASELACEELELEWTKIEEVDCTILDYHECESAVEKYFETQHMIDFCETKSSQELNDDCEYGEKGEVFSLCRGDSDVEPLNPHIYCTRDERFDGVRVKDVLPEFGY